MRMSRSGLAVIFLIASGGLASAEDVPLVHAVDDPTLSWGPCPEFMPEGCRIAVVHGDPSRPNADVLFEVPGGSVIPRHWHSSEERMAALQGELEVRYDGHPAAALRAGRYAFGPARMPHSANCRSSEPCVLFIAFEAPVDAFEGEPSP